MGVYAIQGCPLGCTEKSEKAYQCYVSPRPKNNTLETEKTMPRNHAQKVGHLEISFASLDRSGGGGEAFFSLAESRALTRCQLVLSALSFLSRP
jgi:hypothetical protein